MLVNMPRGLGLRLDIYNYVGDGLVPKLTKLLFIIGYNLHRQIYLHESSNNFT